MLSPMVRRWFPRPEHYFRNRLQKPAGRFRLEVELLEERSVPSAVEIAPTGPTERLASHYLPNHHWLVNQGGGFLTGPNSGQPLDIALNYLTTHTADLGLTASDLSQLIVTDMYTDADVDITHIYLRQAANGLQVQNANLSVHIAAQGEVINVGGGFVANLSGIVGTSIQPQLTAAQAVTYAASHLGLDGQGLTQVQTVGGVDQRVIYAAPGVSRDDISVHLQYMATPDGGADLVWEMVVRTPDGQHWYDVSINAGDGTLMAASDYGKDASYQVFARPTESPADGARTTVVNPAHAVASPFGWHDTNGATGAEFNDTRGNNVDAHTDLDGNDVVIGIDASRPIGGGTLDFVGAVVPLNLPGDPPSAYRAASVVNLFYLNNVSHDLTYLYGFTEVAGNFQQNNYGRGGLGGDAVQADAQDGASVNNADFFTPPDGTPGPRMQMYVFDGPNPDRDGSFDAGIVFHEYVHGVTDRLTGGPANVTALINYQSYGMAEGWSDWYALMFLQKPGDSPNAGYTIGSYALGDPLGARRFPYSFDMSINNQTFDLYNQNGDNGFGIREVHNTGEAWASALWDLNWLLIDRYDYQSDLYNSAAEDGNIMALHLVTQALKLQPANPSFTEARDAILAADTALYGGDNHDLIWEAFARRGLGYSAYTSHSDAMGVNVAFDTPFTKISGQKYNDLDGDGVKDTGEPGLPGWQVYLDVNGNNTFEATIDNARVFNYTGAPVPIPDNATASAPGTAVFADIPVSGLNGLVKEVRVALADGNAGTIDVSHPFVGDLQIDLISPNGTIVPLASQMDESFENGNDFTETFFADAFPTSINAGTPPYRGNFKPEGRLAAFNGETPNGTWRLRVQDQASLDVGLLHHWRLTITTGEPTTTTDAAGKYEFIVEQGTYTVREVPQSGWTQTAPTAPGEHTVTVAFGIPQEDKDFGNYRASSISGTKFTDITGNGPGGGDTPLNGVTINLYRDDGDGVLDAGDGAAIQTTVTAGLGTYTFGNLGQGVYIVEEVVPSGYVRTGPAAPGYYVVTVASGTSYPGRDFYNFRQISISGVKYTDQNGNGSIAGDTPYLLGVAISLFRDDGDGVLDAGDGAAIANTTTSTVDGSYSFSNVGPGRYFVEEIPPVGYGQTFPVSPPYHTIVANSGVNVATAHFGNFQLVTLSGVKFTDITGNGLTGDDTPLSNVTIRLFLDRNGNGALDGGDGVPLATTLTDGVGAYKFANVGAGRYFVQEVPPFGYLQTAPTAPGYHIVVTSSGVNVPGLHFGNFQTITISGAKFLDVTGNGLTADDTTPHAGITISLFRDNGDGVFTAADGGPITNTTTSATGTYSFIGVGPGRYFVQEVVPLGYAQTTPTGPSYYTVDAVSGVNVGGRNFSNFLGGVFSGVKVTDRTRNGFSGDDTPLAGVAINLFRDDGDGVLDAGDSAVGSMLTAAGTGAYSFAALLPGTYFVQEVVPAGYVRTTPTTPNPDYYTFTVNASGQTSANNNFANFQLARISGVKYTDRTGNGVTADDTPLPGVTINLFRDNVVDGVLTAADGPAIAFQVTAAGTGAYAFTDLDVGRYYVQEVLPAGYSKTVPATHYTIDVATSGQNFTGNHFANFQLATISGTKFDDLTGNGPSGDDTPMGNVVISLFRDVNNNSVLDGGDGAAIATTTTAAGTGAYSFIDRGLGRYFVQETVPSGYVQTSPAAPGYYTVNVATSGVNSANNNFHNFLGNFITGRKFTDLDQDGDGGTDPGQGGVVITLYRENAITPGLQTTGADADTFIVSTTTAAGTGAYRLAAPGTTGTFYVAETVPSGMVQTAPGTPSAPGYHTIVVPTDPLSGYDFGNYPLFNTDGIGVYDHTTGKWYLRNTATAGPADFPPFAYGWTGSGLPRQGPPLASSGPTPIVGDWDGNGTTTIGLYLKDSGTWYLRNSNSAGATSYPVFAYGGGNLIPVVGDWDGDGDVTVGVYNPNTATWYLNNNNAAGPASIQPFAYGFAGAIPVVGDWDGDGDDNIGVYNPSTATWYLRADNSPGAPTMTPFAYGFGSKPVVGDWNRDGRDTIGVWDVNTARWYLRDSNTAGAPTIPVFAYGFGTSPLVGDWDFPRTPLRAAGPAIDSTAPDLTSTELQGVVAGAMKRLALAGLDSTTLARLGAVQFNVGSLPGNFLGLAHESAGDVFIDANAAGYGWFIDPTPLTDEEFPNSGPTAGRMDLLSVVLHELGHMAGLEHGTGLMDQVLAPGSRAALDAFFAVP